MSDTDSTFLDNTRKDLVGGITAVVVVTALLRTSIPGKPLDSELNAYLSENSQAINRFVHAVLSAALAEELTNEVNGTLGELIPPQPGYYDRLTINALLSLYAAEPQLKDFCAASEPDFRANCMNILLKKLTDAVSTALWCRVEAYERGAVVSSLNLSEIHSGCSSLVPLGYREQLGSREAWVTEVKTRWRSSAETQKAIKLTAGSISGLTKLLSQF